VFTVIYAVRLIITFVDVNKTDLILSYLILKMTKMNYL